MNNVLALSTFALASTLPNVAIALIFQNGDFELPTVADGTYSSTTANWSGGYGTVNPDSSGHYLGGGGATWPQAASGQQFEDIGNVVTMTLAQTIDISASNTYSFSWVDNTALALPLQFQSSPYTVTILNSLSQPVLSTNFNAYHSNGLWAPRSASIFLSSGIYTLQFTSTNTPQGADALIDTLSISAVPESSSALLLGLGFATILVQRRRPA